MARERDWYTAVEEVNRNSNLSALIAVMAHEVLLEMSIEQLILDRAKRALGLLKAFTSVLALGVKLDINADKVSGSDTGLLDRNPRRLMIEIGELAKTREWVSCSPLDEMHVLSEVELDSMHAAMHAVGQRQLPIATIARVTRGYST